MFNFFRREHVPKETSLYRGENLDRLLIDKFEFERGEEETDVAFIKRIFVDLCHKTVDPSRAVEILFGKEYERLDDQERDIFDQLMAKVRKIQDRKIPGSQRNMKVDDEFKSFAESFLGE